MASGAIQGPIREYAELELEVDRLLTGKLSSTVCALCRKPCCRPDCGREAVGSWWLRQVSTHVHGRWWPDDWKTRETCVALTESGCLLRAGRPPICRSFYCDAFLEPCRDIWEVLFYSFAGDLTGYVTRLSSRVDLTALTAGEAPRYADRIAARIHQARRLLALGNRLLSPCVSEDAKHRDALALFCAYPAFLRAGARRTLLKTLRREALLQ